MKAQDLRDLLVVVVEMAPRLREAGVAVVEHAGLKVTMAPPAPVIVTQQRRSGGHDDALAAITALAQHQTGRASQ